MADLGTIKASTEIYEQRLLITGIFDDRTLHDRFRRAVDGVAGVKRLYWHVVYMTEADQNRRSAELLSWGDALALDTKIGAELIGTRGIADVNYRVAVDSFATVYLIGRARSSEEKAKTLSVTRGVSGVKRLVDYIEVRP
jgi:hyperosmotically inducible protein